MFTNCDFKQKEKMVIKLHKQFAHPTAKHLKMLLQDAGVFDDDCQKVLNDLNENCDLCLKMKKTPSRPVVSLPIASKFDEVVVMDLKEWVKNKTWFLHLIDAATRLTLSAVIHDKHPSTIIEKVMCLWIGAGFGPPGKFLADNGGEFGNDEYRDMCENLNIEVRNTAAYSPWQNGLCERNHAVVDDSVMKMLEENPKLNIETALIWAVNAKNCLHMNSGYSSYQLVFGQNPNLPNVLIDNPPALEGTTISKTFAKHLNALHSSRRAFIKAESSERIRCALRHQIRIKDQIFQSRDKVYYKRDGQHKWRGPGTVIGQDGKVIFVRHGNVYVRVAPCRLIKTGKVFQTDEEQTKQHHPVQEKENQSQPEESDYEDEKVIEEQHIPEVEVNNEIQVPIKTNSIRNVNEIPKIGNLIQYKLNNNEHWNTAKVISRGGKSSGMYANWLNVEDESSGEKACLGFSSMEWKLGDMTESTEEDTITTLITSVDEKQLIREAKIKELDNWNKFNVYDEVADSGQSTISTRWVITKKELFKARLVVRGFEEQSEMQTDSPTAAKDTIRSFFAICSSLNWNVESMDVKSAFLQGDQISRDIFINPPSEASVLNGVLWKLRKVVYGLNDASRNWFFTVRKELLSSHCIQSTIDKAIFRWYDNSKLAGLFVLHVDKLL